MAGSASLLDMGGFDIIVSNPPVHSDHPDDLRVLMGLIRDSPLWLRAGGEIWLVAQEHIPVGRLFALVDEKHQYTHLDLMPTEDGRFVVWRAISGMPGKECKKRKFGAHLDDEFCAAQSELVRPSKV